MAFQHDIAGGQGNLIATSVQSPDFVSGSAGWQVRKDGSAEFNNLVIRGTFDGTDFVINSSGAFFYSPSEAAGNLTASIAPASGTDAFGNAYQAGVFSYGPSGSFAGLLDTGTLAALEMLPPNATTANVTSRPAVFSSILGAGLVNERLIMVATSGKENSHDDAAIQLFSAAADNSIAAQMVFEFGGAIAATLTSTGFTADAWHAMTLGNGWANAGASSVAKYRKVASPPNSVEIIGEIDGGASTSGTFFQLPSGYRPASTGATFAGCTTLTSAQCWVSCDTSGNLALNATAHTNKYFFHGFISLDA